MQDMSVSPEMMIRKNYVSIENQKLIISQYADDHGVKIDRWYEDDGISGYIFDRPGISANDGRSG